MTNATDLEQKIESVQVSPAALAQLKNAQNSYLLGYIDTAKKLVEVTFALPFNHGFASNAKDENAKYLSQALQLYKAINVDYFVVGLYFSGHYAGQDHQVLGNYKVIERINEFAKDHPQAILLTSQQQGQFGAYQLNTAFKKQFAAKQFTINDLEKKHLNYGSIWSQLPLSLLSDQFSVQAIAGLPATSFTDVFTRLDGGNASHQQQQSQEDLLVKQLENMISMQDQLHQDSYKFSKFVSNISRQRQHIQHLRNRQQYQQQQLQGGDVAQQEQTTRSYEDNEFGVRVPSEPSRLDNLLIMAGINAAVGTKN
ncbi:hypothetical protein MP228_003357 [Amoeboaphelidium protococcarum]|nr:hypothetical protein MP228_003357 [Amoeboaphelidium protococcarum]